MYICPNEKFDKLTIFGRVQLRISPVDKSPMGKGPMGKSLMGKSPEGKS